MIIILIIYYLLFIRMHTQWKFNRIVIKLHTYAVVAASSVNNNEIVLL